MTMVFCYARASTIKEVKDGSNIRQKEILKKFCESKGWDYRFYEDEGETGANMNRKKFKIMMEDIEKEKPYFSQTLQMHPVFEAIIFHWEMLYQFRCPALI